MAATDMKTAKLSKAVLGLRFMQRTVIRLEKEQNEDENNRVIDDEHWVIDRPVEEKSESSFIMNPSYVSCEGLVFGRMSFLGFNPEIEKLMKTDELDRAGKREDETSVGDEEMANRFTNIVRSGNIKKRHGYDEDIFTTDSGHTPYKKFKQKQFLKPDD